MSDSNSICFICLHRNDGLEKVTISDIHNVNNVTEVKFVLPELAVLLDPEIPAYHCCSCRTTLHAFYTFKKKCLENYTRLIRNSKIYNNKQIINEKQNVADMEVQITHNYKSSSPLPKEPDVRKSGTEDSIVVKEEIVSEDNVEDRQYYQQQLEFVKCETVSDNEQDGGSSSEDDQLKDETHMNYQDDSLSLATIMVDEPGSSKRVKYNYEKHKKLTDAELLVFLEESDDEIDPYPISSDDDEDTSIVSPNPVQRPETPSSIAQNNDWSYEEVPSQILPFIKTAGLLVNINSTEPIDYFNLIADDDFFDMLCTRANKHAVDLIAVGLGAEPRIAGWVDATPTEMRTFMGLLFHMGTIKLNRMNDYWKKDNLFNLQCFSSFMSRNRFLLILRCLQFEDTDSQEPRTQLSKITPLIEFYNNKMIEIYYPTRELSIDESMVLWKGRVKFRQYTKGKRDKFGMKLYVLCEANGTAIKILVCAGATREEDTDKVVLALMAEKLDNGHSLFMDNLYNSLKLTEELLRRKTYVTGTLRTNRKGNPTDVVQKKLKKGELVVQFNSQGICVVKWKDHRDILTISSEYNARMQKVITQRGQEKQTPILVEKYNEFMAEVEHCDQMMAYYSSEHKTLIWYKKLAVHIFLIMMLTSYHMYKKGNPGNNKAFFDYRLSVIRRLLGPPSSEPLPELRLMHLPELCPKSEGASARAKRRRCQVCWQSGKLRKDSIYYCPMCPSQPGLCLTPCFREFHSKK